MPGLILRLAPHEEVLVNGAVLKNGVRRTQISVVSREATVLRLRRAIAPDEAATPCLRAYYVAQLALSGALDHDAAAEILDAALSELRSSAATPEEDALFVRAQTELAARRFYGVLRALGEATRPQDGERV
jgi:flagellar protein FlbT